MLDGVAKFAASDDTSGREVWRSDGTPEGTTLLADLVPGTSSSWPGRLLRAGREVHFGATDLGHGAELWVTDGTPAGTRLAADLVPGPDSSDAAPLATIGRLSLITTQDLGRGTALWGLTTPLGLSRSPIDSGDSAATEAAADGGAGGAVGLRLDQDRHAR